MLFCTGINCPVEFLGEGSPFTILGVLNDQDRVFGAVNQDLFVISKGGAHLSITEKSGAGIYTQATEADDTVGRDHHGSEGERMGANGSDTDTIQRGADDRTTSGDVVGGGTGRGGDIRPLSVAG